MVIVYMTLCSCSHFVRTSKTFYYDSRKNMLPNIFLKNIIYKENFSAVTKKGKGCNQKIKVMKNV